MKKYALLTKDMTQKHLEGLHHGALKFLESASKGVADLVSPDMEAAPTESV
jgi:hypothetical protein